MTTNEQDASIGRLVRELGECKKALIAVELEFDRATDSLKACATLLKNAKRDTSEDALAESSLDVAIEQLPTAEQLASLLSDLRETRERYRSLSKQGSKIGISI
jgi:hypothetical protein